MSAFCNAGFSPYNDNLGSFGTNITVVLVVSFLIITGGLGFTVLYDLFHSIILRKKRLSFHSRMVLLITAILVVSGSLFFFCTEYFSALSDMPLKKKILSSFFQAVTPRTAGFEIIPQRFFAAPAKLITVILMFIGGSSGSTAGGVKTTTFFIVFMYIIKGNAEKTNINLFNRKIATATIEKAFNIVMKSMLCIFISVLLLLFSERALLEAGHYGIFDLLFESVSAFCTVGLTIGLTPSLSIAGKLILIFTMFLGRIGIFALVLGFVKSEKEKFVEFPSGKLLVG
nr:potassium transporter TrkG [Brucepastera parasyntrophica]